MKFRRLGRSKRRRDRPLDPRTAARGRVLDRYRRDRRIVRSIEPLLGERKRRLLGGVGARAEGLGPNEKRDPAPEEEKGGQQAADAAAAIACVVSAARAESRRRERYGSRSREGLRKAGEHRQVGVKLDAAESANAAANTPSARNASTPPTRKPPLLPHPQQRRRGGDGGIDLVLSRDGHRRCSRTSEAARYNRRRSVSIVRESEAPCCCRSTITA
jgi:hypothetical protein